MNISPLLRVSQPVLTVCRSFNCWTAAITKKRRKIYERTYPTKLVLPNGSSITISYHEPRGIIILPLDVNTLSESERKLRMDKRRGKSKVEIVQEIEDEFDESKYIKY